MGEGKRAQRERNRLSEKQIDWGVKHRRFNSTNFIIQLSTNMPSQLPINMKQSDEIWREGKKSLKKEIKSTVDIL